MWLASARAMQEVHVSKERLRQQLRTSRSKPGICICLGPSFRSIRPYNSGPTVTNLGTTVSPITVRPALCHGDMHQLDASRQSSSSPSRAILVSSYAIVSSNRRLARRPRSPSAAFGGAHGRPAHLWISPLALCYDWRSARAGAGERPLPLPAKSLASVARQSRPCPEPINP